MSVALYWRLLLVAAPVLCLVAAVLLAVIATLFAPPEVAARRSFGGMVSEIVRVSTESGLLAAYLAWVAAFLVKTRGFHVARLRHWLWLAPLTFVPLHIAVWLALRLTVGPKFGEGKLGPVEDAVYLGVSIVIVELIALYVLILLGFALEWLLRRAGWIEVAGEAIPATTNR